ncbi:hypothetical protein LOD99_1034 [Oopsacas minuta]|uniref:Uncharacterized protein n=1 Tax=Oopsacas minuta TaxID=111878 RepID=A0AAV7K1Q5_9METZ|nr:hypothetical protein LOD99_1034 [Oopsacas minuta]
MWKKINYNKHNKNLKMQPYNSTISIKKRNYEMLYKELFVEREKLLEEMQEYRNLQQLFDANKKKCDQVNAECERFMQVLLVHYEILNQSKAEEKERARKWTCESDQLKEMVTSLSRQVIEKDKELQFFKSKNQMLEEQFKELEISQEELRTELRVREEKVELLTQQNETTDFNLSNANLELENFKQKTINSFMQKDEFFNEYMDKVAFLHTDINKTLQRCKIPICRIVKPIRTSCYNDQIEAMKESINQLDEVASNAINCIIRQESLNDLKIENDKLRDEQEETWHRFRMEEALVATLKATNRYNKTSKDELEKQVNSYAERERGRTNTIQCLLRTNDELKCESRRYQDQVKMLQRDKDRLQKETDSAKSDAKTAMLSLNEEPHMLCESNLTLQQKIKDLEYDIIQGNREIISLERMIDRIRTTLRLNILVINNCESLTTLLNELENPSQFNWNSIEQTVS